MHSLADLRKKLLKLATTPVPAEPQPIVVNITMPDIVGDLMERIGDGHGGIRTTPQRGVAPG